MKILQHQKGKSVLFLCHMQLTYKCIFLIRENNSWKPTENNYFIREYKGQLQKGSLIMIGFCYDLNCNVINNLVSLSISDCFAQVLHLCVRPGAAGL